MSFFLRKGRPAGPELRRVALEELAAARERLGAGDVHQTRRALKALRALLALAGEPAARQAARRLQEAGRLLSATRDHEVCLHTLDRLAVTLDAPSQAVLCRAREALGPRPPLPPAAARKARARLETVNAFLSAWEPQATLQTVRAGVRRSYRKARHAHAAAREEGAEAEALHDLRKCVKRLWAQLRLVCRMNPGTIEPLIAQADGIAELLGGEHDLAVLAARLSEAGVPPPENLAPRRREYQEAALGLAARFLEEKPRAFAKRCFGG